MEEDFGAGLERGEAAEAEGVAFALAVLLATLAGFVDATGYIHFHRLFVSFMSGNSTQAMVAAAQGDALQLAVLGRTILLFVAGVTIGEMLDATSRRWGSTRVLTLETVLLSAAIVGLRAGWGEGVIASALALAMGVQNAAVHKADGISVALTYVTGTLVHVGRSIAKALRGAGAWRAALPFVGLWIGLVAGGLAGALAADRSLVLALSIATGVCLVLLVWSVAAAVTRHDPG